MTVNRRSFRALLEKALSGDHDSIMELLDVYQPLIEKHSRVYGYIDEDCRQYIQLRFVIALRHFEIAE